MIFDETDTQIDGVWRTVHDSRGSRGISKIIDRPRLEAVVPGGGPAKEIVHENR